MQRWTNYIDWPVNPFSQLRDLQSLHEKTVCDLQELKDRLFVLNQLRDEERRMWMIE